MRLRYLLMSTLAAIAVGGAASSAETATPAVPQAGTVGDQTTSINIDTSDKPLETVLQWISRRAGVNVVCNDREEAERPTRVTLRLSNVTWQEAIKQIADKYGFVVEKQSERIWNLSRPPRVRMDLQSAPLGTVLEALARQAGVNIVFTDIDAAKPITVTLQGVPWKEALDVIVKDAGYAWIQREYNIVQVVTPDKLQKDLSTRIFQINYHNAEELSKLIGKQLGDGGSADVDKRSNSIICVGTPIGLETAARVIKELDLRTRQVLIEMRFMDYSDNDARSIGFDPVSMGFNLANVGPIAANFTPFAATPTATLSGTRTPANVPNSTGNFNMTTTFEAISTLSSTEILQAPSILVVDNQEGEIRIGREIHFAETTVEAGTANSASTTTIAEAASSPVKDGISILVTPHIGSDGFVTLDLKSKNDEVQLVTFTNGKPANDPNYTAIQLPNIDQQEVKTRLLLGDGKIGAIGGLLRNKTVEKENKVPWLSDIPLFGLLFKKRQDSVEKRNLTIFIRPRVVSSERKAELEQRTEEMKASLGSTRATKMSPAPVPATAKGE